MQLLVLALIPVDRERPSSMRRYKIERLDKARRVRIEYIYAR